MYFSLVENSREFIAMADLEFRPFYINPAGLRMVGFEQMQEASRFKVPDFYFPEDQAFITEEFLPRALRENQAEVEIRFRHFKTGEPIWMLHSVFRIQDGRGVAAGWATVSRDISDRKKTDLALGKSEERLRLALDAAKMATFEWDVPHDRIIWSHYYEKLWGRALESSSTPAKRSRSEYIRKTCRASTPRWFAAWMPASPSRMSFGSYGPMTACTG